MKPQDRQAGHDTDDAVAIHVMGWFWQSNQWGRMAWFENGPYGMEVRMFRDDVRSWEKVASAVLLIWLLARLAG